MINFFKIFSNHKLDKTILEEYELIYLYIEEIEKDLLFFYRNRWVDYVRTIKENRKEINRAQATLKKIFNFILRLKQEYKKFSPESKKMYEFKETQDNVEKKNILEEVRKISKLLEFIQQEVKLAISVEQLKNFSLLHLFKELNQLVV